MFRSSGLYRSGLSRLLVLSLLALLGACVVDASGEPMQDDEELELGSASSALTSVQLFATTNIAQGASKTGVYTATTAGELTFRTAGSGDVDLYVRKASAPTRTTFDAKSAA